MIDFAHITKRFAGVTALDDVSLSIRAGECHALMGENGAGKSTLAKVLAGIHRPDDGAVRLDGQAVSFNTPRDAGRAGIGMVHQELAYCADLSIAENLALGSYPRKLGVVVDRRAMAARARQLLAEVGAMLDVRRTMRSLSIAHRQIVQIAAALATGAKVIIFDEPTSSLSDVEAEQLFALIERLKGRGLTMIYVSHRMPEVLRLCDRISVLRDGRLIGTLDRDAATQARIVQMMIGRPLDEYFPQHLGGSPGDAVLEVQRLSSPGHFMDVNFNVRRGEIVGMAGLVGAGRSAVAQAIFGLDRRATGVVRVAGRPLRLGDPRRAMAAGVGLVPEDRKQQGLVLDMSCRRNFSLHQLDRFSRLGLLDHRGEARAARAMFDRLDVRTPSIDTAAAALSGGNQQKVVLAKWLAMKLNVLIVDEPTRGVDVGAKAAIHGLIDTLAHQGVGVLLIGSDLPEVLNLATRVLVMREGRIIGDLPRARATQPRVLEMMAGIASAAP